jgi:hypothetical protein
MSEDIEKVSGTPFGASSGSGEDLPTFNEQTKEASDVQVKHPPPRRSFRDRFAAEVSTDHADLLLLACCLISGFIDSTLYNGEYRESSRG